MTNKQSVAVNITKIDKGNDTLPCHFFASETCTSVCFETDPGIDSDMINDIIYSLFDDACNIEYSVSTGKGKFKTIDRAPSVGSYEYLM
ncbi:hypothetical protein [Pectobacterium carotovorum]|uniref:hypothetical protein n=1 Tax=Pectobacterium carotovorum TaxID=554 RepID=UPI0011152B0E|nr:hypothetical protein [Pectobacterium carotovorum]